jgi:hypothetical protein
VEIGGFGEGMKQWCAEVYLSLEKTYNPCVFTGEELCSGLKRGCTLDCPYGFLTDAHNCEICQCRSRPKKCRPIICDKYCPLGYLYVFLNSENLWLSVTCWNVHTHSVGCLCLCEYVSDVLSPEYPSWFFARWFRKQGKDCVQR